MALASEKKTLRQQKIKRYKLPALTLLVIVAGLQLSPQTKNDTGCNVFYSLLNDTTHFRWCENPEFRDSSLIVNFLDSASVALTPEMLFAIRVVSLKKSKSKHAPMLPPVNDHQNSDLSIYNNMHAPGQKKNKSNQKVVVKTYPVRGSTKAFMQIRSQIAECIRRQPQGNQQ